MNQPDDEDLEHGKDAVVHALLDEQLGDVATGAADPATIARRFAAGDGARAAAVVRRAATGAGISPLRGLRGWTLLCAAAAVAVVALLAWDAQSRGGDDADEATTHDRQRQDPSPPVAPVRVADIRTFVALLPKVERIQLEVLRLPDSNLPFDVAVKGTPVQATAEQLASLVHDLPDQLRVEQPAAADWQNELTFVLRDGRVMRGAIYPYGRRDEGLIVHLTGLQGDLRVGARASAALRDLLAAATHAACLANGVVRSADDLETFPANLERLRLFGLQDADLKGLARFPKLTALDVSGLKGRLGEDGLRAIEKHAPKLKELVLDGLDFADDDLMHLTDLIALERLSMRRVRGFTGEGFFWYSVSAKYRAGPQFVDLSLTNELTDKGLRRICEWDPRVLVLQDAEGAVTREGFGALLETENLRELDLRGWQLEDKGMLPTMRALQARAELTILP